ncbi:hypothetical protein [Bacillus sp. T33-2]|uniref:hypothetical protein n=1 Tax=Bacillus sp. T33-2 TaxID=2054168 RepID=UPI0015E0E332|nr:hypothetical protein [Bacillus sp. T33-2]
MCKLSNYELLKKSTSHEFDENKATYELIRRQYGDAAAEDFKQKYWDKWTTNKNN